MRIRILQAVEKNAKVLLCLQAGKILTSKTAHFHLSLKGQAEVQSDSDSDSDQAPVNSREHPHLDSPPGVAFAVPGCDAGSWKEIGLNLGAPALLQAPLCPSCAAAVTAWQAEQRCCTTRERAVARADKDTCLTPWHSTGPRQCHSQRRFSV